MASWRFMIMAATCAFATPIVPSQAMDTAPPAIQPLDYFETQTAVDPQLSPDGRYVVYGRVGQDIRSDRAVTRLWLYTLADGSERPLDGDGDTASPSLAGANVPCWSPDGRRIAFVAGEGGQNSSQIHIFDMATGTVRKISNLTYKPSRLSWSPDGKNIAFLMPVAPDDAHIALPDAPDAGGWRGNSEIIDALVFRYDGGGLARPRRHALYIIPVDGGEARKLSGDEASFAGYGGFSATQGYPSWMPDGRSIVISGRPVERGPAGEDDFSGSLQTDIFVYALDGPPRRLTTGPGNRDQATVSPDGRWIAYMGADNSDRMYQQRHLWVMPVAGATARKLTGTLDRDMESFAWDRDGRSLVIGYQDSGRNKIGRIDLAGRVRELAANAGSGNGVYLGTGMDLSTGPGGMIAYTLQTAKTPGDLGLWRNGKLLQLTHLNADFMAKRSPGTYEERWFTSSGDGRKVQAFVIKPPHFDPSRKYPMLMWIHGGPFEAMGGHYDYEFQRVAGAGYVVLFVNPRGSTGFGYSFADALQDEFPGDLITADLMSGVDTMVSEPWIDPDRLYVAGGSAGGVMTNWLIGKTNRFRAAISAYGMFDMASWALENDMPIRVMRQWFGGTPWERREAYWRRSPMRLVENVRTPTMIMVGDHDWRVPATQGEKMYTALKLRGVEARLVRFPGEGHGIYDIPSNRVAKVNAMIDWLDRHGGRE